MSKQPVNTFRQNLTLILEDFRERTENGDGSGASRDKAFEQIIAIHLEESNIRSMEWRIEQMRQVRTFMPKLDYDKVLDELEAMKHQPKQNTNGKNGHED